jgi:hypothetical protein
VRNLEKLELHWTKLKKVKPDGILNMTGRKIGLMGRIIREMDRQNTDFWMELLYIIKE